MKIEELLRSPRPRPPAAALGCLCSWYGFFFAAHRALGDCQALLQLLIVSGQLLPLFTAAQKPSYVVRAGGKTWDFKDQVKARRYQFRDSPVKCWQKIVATKEEAAEERQWLRDAVYGHSGDDGSTTIMSPKERFL